MRLLICTQKVDKNDSVLGFFHRWLEEFAKHCDSVLVLCLSKGEVDLPANVYVYSLGKEKGAGRLTIAFRFLRNIWVRRTEYDAVFVHMNPEYLLLGGLFWRLWGKRIALWYNHKKGSTTLKLSARLAHTIFFTSPSAYTARYKKSVQAPAGIDLDLFKRKEGDMAPKNSILFLGRISPVKHVEEFIAALIELDSRGVKFRASIVGPTLSADNEYAATMRARAKPLVEKGVLVWKSGVPHKKTRDLYVSHAVYVNVTPSGSFDKTILEAIACGALPIVSNTALENASPSWCVVENEQAATIADAVEKAVALKDDEVSLIGRKMRSYVESEHSLKAVADLVVKELSKPSRA